MKRMIKNLYWYLNKDLAYMTIDILQNPKSEELLEMREELLKATEQKANAVIELRKYMNSMNIPFE